MEPPQDREIRPPLGAAPPTSPEMPKDASGGRPRTVQSFGIMPMLLGLAALVAIAWLLFGGDPAPNEPVQPRTSTQQAPK